MDASTFAPLLDAVVTTIIDNLAVIISGFVVALVKQYTGIQIEARHREALNSAIVSGAKKAYLASQNGQIDLAVALRYVQNSVPDALGWFKPSEGFLLDKLENAVLDVSAEHVAAPGIKVIEGVAQRLPLPVNR